MMCAIPLKAQNLYSLKYIPGLMHTACFLLGCGTAYMICYIKPSFQQAHGDNNCNRLKTAFRLSLPRPYMGFEKVQHTFYTTTYFFINHLKHKKGYEPYAAAVISFFQKYGAEVLVADYEAKPINVTLDVIGKLMSASKKVPVVTININE